MRGEVYMIDGFKIFTFGGASSIDKGCRVINKNWWERETFNEEEKNNAFDNLKKHNNEVDFIITQTCSSSTLKYICEYNDWNLYKDDSHNQLFEEIKNTIKFKKWYFGHMHLDLDIGEKETVLFDKVVKLF